MLSVNGKIERRFLTRRGQEGRFDNQTQPWGFRVLHAPQQAFDRLLPNHFRLNIYFRRHGMQWKQV